MFQNPRFDLVRDLYSPIPEFQRRAQQIALTLMKRTSVRDGVIRWGDGSVPDDACVQLAAHCGMPVDVAKSCDAARGIVWANAA